jgi:DNA mismatch endonuclease (patch repair protein)
MDPDRIPDRPAPLNEHVRRRMASQLRAGTRPELDVRRLIHAAGKRYRVGYPVPGKPRRSIDIAFPSCRVAVFIDGCFWHRCPFHSNAPANNSQWWEAKLNANVARDRDTEGALEAAGWSYLRIWEHVPPELAAERVLEAIG